MGAWESGRGNPECPVTKSTCLLSSCGITYVSIKCMNQVNKRRAGRGRRRGEGNVPVALMIVLPLYLCLWTRYLAFNHELASSTVVETLSMSLLLVNSYDYTSR